MCCECYRPDVLVGFAIKRPTIENLLVMKRAALLLLGVMAAPPVVGQNARGITAIDGIRVGHHTLEERPTGCTVILTEEGVIASVDVRGSSPGTRETDLLRPENTVERVHAIVLSGGSAFGLDVATGVMRYLDERDIGFDLGYAKVPIVPAAILLDLRVGGKPEIRPDADCGYAAARAASSGPVAEGNVGAGTGATVGKTSGFDRAMKSGIGTSLLTLPNGLQVAAIVAVNAGGDVIDPATGQVIAGARTADGKKLADARQLLRNGASFQARPGENTTIGVIATNAALTKTETNKVAQMAHDGLARAINPSHTAGDGDTLFALATGTWDGDVSLSQIGGLAAEVTSEAIVRAVLAAESLPGLPAARDLER